MSRNKHRGRVLLAAPMLGFYRAQRHIAMSCQAGGYIYKPDMQMSDENHCTISTAAPSS